MAYGLKVSSCYPLSASIVKYVLKTVRLYSNVLDKPLGHKGQVPHKTRFDLDGSDNFLYFAGQGKYSVLLRFIKL